jgi:hypothetical protein
MVCWKHPVARQLAVHAVRHHARQQALDGDADKRGGRWKPSNAGAVGKLHNVRSALGVASALIFAWALGSAG